jgi:uncharacterized protein YggE
MSTTSFQALTRRCRGTPRRRLPAALGAMLLAGAMTVSAALAADGPDAAGAAAIPQIAASGTAEIRVPPTKASFSLDVITDAPTSAQAAADNARVHQAVERALERARLTRKEIVGSRLTVFPRWVYDEAAHRQKRAGFEATHTIEIETPNLDRLGAYVDAALGAGASSVSQIEFAAENPAAARREVLAQAVRNARGDADAMARAAGGALGGLLSISTEQPVGVPGMRFEAVAAARKQTPGPATSISPSEIRVTAHVTARWRFVPARQ